MKYIDEGAKNGDGGDLVDASQNTTKDFLEGAAEDAKIVGNPSQRDHQCSGSYQIFLKTWDATIVCNVPCGHTILQLRVPIAERLGVSLDNHWITAAKLDKGVPRDGTVHVLLRLQGAGKKDIDLEPMKTKAKAYAKAQTSGEPDLFNSLSIAPMCSHGQPPPQPKCEPKVWTPMLSTTSSTCTGHPSREPADAKKRVTFSSKDNVTMLTPLEHTQEDHTQENEMHNEDGSCNMDLPYLEQFESSQPCSLPSNLGTPVSLSPLSDNALASQQSSASSRFSVIAEIDVSQSWEDLKRRIGRRDFKERLQEINRNLASFVQSQACHMFRAACEELVLNESEEREEIEGNARGVLSKRNGDDLMSRDKEHCAQENTFQFQDPPSHLPPATKPYHHEILGLPCHAPLENVKARYRKLVVWAQVQHDDIVWTINHARDVLIDAGAQYEEQLNGHRVPMGQDLGDDPAMWPIDSMWWCLDTTSIPTPNKQIIPPSACHGGESKSSTLQATTPLALEFSSRRWTQAGQIKVDEIELENISDTHRAQSEPDEVRSNPKQVLCSLRDLSLSLFSDEFIPGGCLFIGLARSYAAKGQGRDQTTSELATNVVGLYEACVGTKDDELCHRLRRGASWGARQEGGLGDHLAAAARHLGGSIVVLRMQRSSLLLGQSMTIDDGVLSGRQVSMEDTPRLFLDKAGSQCAIKDAVAIILGEREVCARSEPVPVLR